MPFANILTAERIERVVTRHGNWFGRGLVYSTAVMVWSFLGRVLRDGKGASRQAAMARVVAHCQASGSPAPTSDTGGDCRARNKLSAAAPHDLGVEVADETEEQAPAPWGIVPLSNRLSASTCPLAPVLRGEGRVRGARASPSTLTLALSRRRERGQTVAFFVFESGTISWLLSPTVTSP